MQYDLAVTCRASLEVGVDDVGTSLRTILHAHAHAGRRCVAFVGVAPGIDFTADCPVPVEFVLVSPSATPFFSNRFDPALAFAQALSDTINAFLDRHSIACIEFPDRGAEGWFFTHLNLVHRRIPSIAVRLHGADWLIDEDNAVPEIHTPRALLYAAERETLLRVDHLLFGGAALLSRTLASFTTAEAAALGSRCHKSPVPFPAATPVPSRRDTSATKLKIGYVGPLEYRLGADLLVQHAVRYFARNPQSRIEVHVAGPDSATANGRSFAAYLGKLASTGPTSRFHVDHRLAPRGFPGRAAELDAVILPARFAHRPAALGAALAAGRPVFVSSLGDLTESVNSHAGVRVFDPLDNDAWNLLFNELEKGLPFPEVAAAPAEFQMDVGVYANLTTQPPAALPPVRLAIVIPHLDDADNLARLIERLNASPARDHLEIIVVDDGSAPAVRARLDTLRTGSTPVILLDTALPRSGPFSARLTGTRAATADYVAYVDSDDYIEETKYLRYAQTLAETPALDVMVPAQRFFGGETDVCLFGLKAKFTLLAGAFVYAGLAGRKTTLLAAFSHAARAADQVAHAEDWLFGASLLFTGAQIAAVPEVAYHYNRAMPVSRSRIRGFMHWQTRAIIERHYDRCVEEAAVNGTMAACELRLLRRLSITHTATNAAQAAARGNRVPWHTHVFRAFRSLSGDRRYRP
jgi:glycosyltransferase involved in cell wall biosynthesis